MNHQRNEPLRFIHVGDMHVRSQLEPPIKNIIQAINRRAAPDFIMTGGDNTDAGLAEEYKTFVKAVSALNSPLYVSRGNHDFGKFSDYMAPYRPARRAELPQAGSRDMAMYLWNGFYWEQHSRFNLNIMKPEPVHYPFYRSVQEPIVILQETRPWAYAFRKKGWRFIVLDTSTWILNDPQLNWLTGELERDTATPTILFIHHSLLPCGNQFDGAPLWNRWQLLDILGRQPAVKAVFLAHLHMSRIWNYGHFKIVTTDYRRFREVVLGQERIESISPLAPYECKGRGQNFENGYFFVSRWLGRMFRLRDARLWHFPVARAGDPDCGFAWGEHHAAQDMGLEWTFCVPKKHEGLAYRLRVQFACFGQWVFQLADARDIRLTEKKGRGAGEYRVAVIDHVFPKAGLYRIRLIQPGGQQRVEGRAAYFAFAGPRRLDLAQLHMQAPERSRPIPRQSALRR